MAYTPEQERRVFVVVRCTLLMVTYHSPGEGLVGYRQQCSDFRSVQSKSRVIGYVLLVSVVLPHVTL